MSNELRLSVSKTKTFLDCKAKYKYSYIEKLPKKDWEFHTFGKFCHKVLEDFHNAYINGSSEPYNIVMSKAFKDSLNEYKSVMTTEMRRDCWKIIDQYLKIVSSDKKNNLSANVIACEKNFEFLVGGKVILNGMIDRIQIDDDNVIHVCDYKTVKNKKYFKHDFEYITTEFTVPEILKIQDKYLEYANQILKEKEYAPNPTALCNFCDYLNMCPEGKAKSYGQNIYGEVTY